MENNLHALDGDLKDLTNDEVQKDVNVDDEPLENQDREIDPSESSSDTLEAHSGIGFQNSMNSIF